MSESELFPPAGLHAMKNYFTSSRYSEEKLSELQQRYASEWADDAEWPDDEIDFSDIPELTEEDFKRALPNPFHGRVDLDAPVLYRSDFAYWLSLKKRMARNWLHARFRGRMSRVFKRSG